PLNKKEDWMRFIRGGFFRNMLVKYPESDMMHKKMLFLSRAIGFYRDYPEFKEMQRHLFRAQCNCAYWHGIFGGIYMRHLRAAIFHELLQCQKILHKVAGGGLHISNSGAGYSGYNEIQFCNGEYCLRILPEFGAAVSEFAEYKSCHNIGFVLRRRREVYHENLNAPGAAAVPGVVSGGTTGPAVKADDESALKQDIWYDWYDRFSFISHFFQKDVRLFDFFKCAYGEQGDFVNQVFKPVDGSVEGELDFIRAGHVWCGSHFADVTVEKKFSLRGNFVLVYNCKITNTSDRGLRFYPGTEMNLSPSSPLAASFLIGGREEKCDAFFDGRATKVLLDDKKYGMKIEFTYSAPANIWMFPVYTVCRLEDGLKKMYQGTSLTFCDNVFLEPRGIYERNLEVKIT
ncbi:DUF1926 domain-containing protein, partial [bacterium]|nr:DUF1926 domain-containing protein [bacterium]